MKSKGILLFTTLAMALALMAQSTTPTTPAAPADNAKMCACCNHDQAAGDKTDSKMMCCGKGGACAKDGCCQGKDGKSCAMMSKNKDGGMSCCGEGKCPMMSSKEKGDKAGKGCCGGKMCQRPQTGA